MRSTGLAIFLETVDNHGLLVDELLVDGFRQRLPKEIAEYLMTAIGLVEHTF